MRLLAKMKKARKLFNQSPVLAFKALLQNLPARPLWIGDFYVLEFSGQPSVPLRGAGKVRDANPDDIDGMCLLEDKRATFNERFSAGHHCIVAEAGDQIVGFAWFSAGSHHIEERYKYHLDIPDDAIYAFDALIKPEYRGRGIWPLFQKHFLEFLAANGKDRILTIIERGNNPSLRAHGRFGYVIVCRVFVILLLGRQLIKSIRPNPARDQSI